MPQGLISRLQQDRHGAMVVETAIVLPALVMLSLGAFDASKMIARQTELQQAVAEAAQIALASTPDTQSERDTIAGIIRTSTGLTGTKAQQVVIGVEYRCGTSTTLSTANTCGTTGAVSTYMTISVNDTYTPIWTGFGIGSPVSLTVSRKVVIS